MWCVQVFCLVFLATSCLLCSAEGGPFGMVKVKSKGVQIKHAPQASSLHDQVIHHAKEGIEHQKESKSILKSRRTREAHRQAALYHKQESQKVHQQIENKVPYGVEGFQFHQTDVSR
ncbi:uncharacterized protein FA14DRAFT_156508 [Meira miltonrushii]|uniref:Uncharacterized protein n=1 Tax=Meira miltonrushii TaxID=1280837 RepID=A0A316V9U5_9BASI|nr:uncharacterized protein FA14DRAFT_156508 [Meira miltonrushii]PWN33828.1 hypothetical protein FA14DRAFT_156508 [Meira miltonrushii]